MLIITLYLKSRQGIDLNRIRGKLIKMLRHPDLVGHLANPNDHDAEKLFRLSVKIGDGDNSAAITQVGAINSQWFTPDHPRRRLLESKIIEAVNGGLSRHVPLRNFAFEVSADTQQALQRTDHEGRPEAQIPAK